MQRIAKNEVLGHFLESGVSNLLDIAYQGNPKCFSTFGYGKRSCIINQVWKMCINCAKTSQKWGFWQFSRARSIGLIQYCIYWYRTKWCAGFGYCINHFESLKIRKMPFWMIQIAKNEDFSQFLEFGWSDQLDTAYFDRTKWCARFSYHIIYAG